MFLGCRGSSTSTTRAGGGFLVTPEFVAYLNTARNDLAEALGLAVGTWLPVMRGERRCRVAFPDQPTDWDHLGLDRQVDCDIACVVLDKHPTEIIMADVVSWRSYVRPSFNVGTHVRDCAGRVYRVEKRDAWYVTLVVVATGTHRIIDSIESHIWRQYSAADFASIAD
jgi:hypothetical protein